MYPRSVLKPLFIGLALASILFVIGVLMAACGTMPVMTGTVTDKRFVPGIVAEPGKPVVVPDEWQLLVVNDGRAEWRRVSQPMFDECEIGEVYPVCRETTR